MFHPTPHLLMNSFGAWNIRGLNSSLKQKEVKHFIAINKLVLVGNLGTKVRDGEISKVSKSVFGDGIWNWNFVHNNNLNPRGCVWVA